MPKTASKSGVSEAVALATAPALAYGAAYLFESAYAAHFAVPRFLVVVSLESVFTALAALVSGLFVIGLVANLVYSGLYHNRVGSTPLGRELLAFTAVGLLFAAFLALYSPTKTELAVYVIAFVLATGLSLIWPLVTQRELDTYGEKLDAQAKLEREVVMGIDLIASRFSVSLRRLIFGSILFLAGAHAAGTGSAKRQDVFLVPEGSPSYVLVRVYSGVAVAAKFDREASALCGFLLARPLDSSLWGAFVSQQLGPLGPPTRDRRLTSRCS